MALPFAIQAAGQRHAREARAAEHARPGPLQLRGPPLEAPVRAVHVGS